MLGIKAYVVYGMILSVVVFGAYRAVRAYFLTKAKLTHVEAVLEKMAEIQLQSEKEVLIAEKEVLVNVEIQRHAVSEILHRGHLSGSTNPDWMREHEQPRISSHANSPASDR